MKALIEKAYPAFTPFAISVLIESPEEAQVLWHRLNIPHSIVRRQADEARHICVFPEHPGMGGTHGFLRVLDEYMTEHSLKGGGDGTV